MGSTKDYVVENSDLNLNNIHLREGSTVTLNDADSAVMDLVARGFLKEIPGQVKEGEDKTTVLDIPKGKVKPAVPDTPKGKVKPAVPDTPKEKVKPGKVEKQTPVPGEEDSAKTELKEEVQKNEEAKDGDPVKTEENSN